MSNYPEWDSSAVNPDIYIEKYIDYVKTSELREILDGKTVAIVGPSSHIDGQNLGNYIDSFDVVVRVGFLEEPTEIAMKDYGSRTDIIIHSFNSFEIPVASRNIGYLSKCKHIICGMVSSDFIDDHESFFDSLRGIGIKVQNVEDSYLYGFFRKVGTICNLGTVGIEIILKYEIKSLFVTGINFYNMGRYGKVYNEEYFDVVSSKMGIYKNELNGTVNGISARSDLHSQKPQIEHFKSVVRSDDRVLLDKYLEDNLFVS